MKHLLIIASIDWADEFNCDMFGVFTDEQWKTLCEKTKKFFKKWETDDFKDDEEKPYSESGEVECGFGTNEYLTFSSYEDWIGNFETKVITQEQYNFLKKSFGKTWGTASGAFYIANRDEDGDVVEMED
jgi:hypothetical protein